MNTKFIGNVGEAFVLAKLVEMGIPVYQQFGDNEPADYIILVNNKPIKIQVKTSTSFKNGKIQFELCSSTMHRKNGVRHIYTIDEVYAFLCYDFVNKNIFLIRNDGSFYNINIRYDQPKNNQYSKVHNYKDFLLSEESLYKLSDSIHYRNIYILVNTIPIIR